MGALRRAPPGCAGVCIAVVGQGRMGSDDLQRLAKVMQPYPKDSEHPKSYDLLIGFCNGWNVTQCGESSVSRATEHIVLFTGPVRASRHGAHCSPEARRCATEFFRRVCCISTP